MFETCSVGKEETAPFSRALCSAVICIYLASMLLIIVKYLWFLSPVGLVERVELPVGSSGLK